MLTIEGLIKSIPAFRCLSCDAVCDSRLVERLTAIEIPISSIPPLRCLSYNATYYSRQDDSMIAIESGRDEHLSVVTFLKWRSMRFLPRPTIWCCPPKHSELSILACSRLSCTTTISSRQLERMLVTEKRRGGDTVSISACLRSSCAVTVSYRQAERVLATERTQGGEGTMEFSVVALLSRRCVQLSRS